MYLFAGLLSVPCPAAVIDAEIAPAATNQGPNESAGDLIEPLQPISEPLHLPQNPISCNAAECEGWPRTAAASGAYSAGPSNDNEKGAIAGGAYILSHVRDP